MRPAGRDRHENMSHDFLVSTRRRRRPPRRRGEHPLQNRQSVSSLETNSRARSVSPLWSLPGDRWALRASGLRASIFWSRPAAEARALALERGLSHVASHIGQQDHHRRRRGIWKRVGPREVRLSPDKFAIDAKPTFGFVGSSDFLLFVRSVPPPTQLLQCLCAVRSRRVRSCPVLYSRESLNQASSSFETPLVRS